MNLIVVSFGVFIIFFLPHQNFLSAPYKLKHEFANFTYVNKETFPEMKIVNFKFNKTMKAFNVTTYFNGYLTEDSYVHIQGFQFRSNEYRRGPINFNVKSCRLLREGTYGTGIFMTNSNLTSCPIKKGYYHLHDISLESEKCPPFVPVGHWKVLIQLFLNDEMVFEAVWLMKVEN